MLEEGPLGCVVEVHRCDQGVRCCRVASVKEGSRAAAAGVLVNDVVEAANGYVPPFESDEEDALSTFFAGLGFPLRLSLRRRSDHGDEAPFRRNREGEAPSLPEPFLKKCIAELLYTKEGAAVACKIIERAEPREIIYQRCMDVRTATAHAVAVEPGRVQSLASWTPEDEDPTVSRDEAASRVPLADAEESEDIPLVRDAPRVLSASTQPSYVDGGTMMDEEESVVVPGSALSRLLELATGDDLTFGAGEAAARRDTEDQFVRISALRALAALCRGNARIAEATVVEGSLPRVVALVGGARGGAVAAAACGCLAAVAGAYHEWSPSGACASLKWLLRPVAPRTRKRRVIGDAAPGAVGPPPMASSQSFVGAWSVDARRCKEAALALLKVVENDGDAHLSGALDAACGTFLGTEHTENVLLMCAGVSPDAIGPECLASIAAGLDPNLPLTLDPESARLAGDVLKRASRWPAGRRASRRRPAPSRHSCATHPCIRPDRCFAPSRRWRRRSRSPWRRRGACWGPRSPRPLTWTRPTTRCWPSSGAAPLLALGRPTRSWRRPRPRRKARRRRSPGAALPATTPRTSWPRPRPKPTAATRSGPPAPRTRARWRRSSWAIGRRRASRARRGPSSPAWKRTRLPRRAAPFRSRPSPPRRGRSRRRPAPTPSRRSRRWTRAICSLI